ncbi:MAG: DUF5703 domain-containing protein [Candidatus Latescibacterota bacterium]
MLALDYRALVSRADLIYGSPVENSLEGQPIGNGRMGTMVWTTPEAIHFQINRSDVFAVNKDHAGPQWDPADTCGGCAQVTVDLGGQPFQSQESFQQRLSLYEAEDTVAGEEVSVRCFVSAVSDLLVIEVDDRRAVPSPMRVTVSMWRASEVKTGNHRARYEFADTPDALLVAQRFDEGDYHCASAVACRVVGVAAQVKASSERSHTLLVPASRGKTVILISSAASWSPHEDMGRTALGVLDGVSEASYDTLRQEHARWWSGFWSRTFVHLTSPDGVGDFMERVRILHLYYMAASSRGALPPKWNGSLFITEGDIRHWGSQYWVWTTEMAYLPLFAADALDLAEPYFRMHLKQLPACRRAAQQRWGVAGGAFFPETASFDGPVVLPDDVAREFRDVLLGRESHTDLSSEARALGQFDGHLSQAMAAVIGRYTYISHVVSSGCEIAVQMWWRYRYSGDQEWLRQAYPLLRDAVEFYRHFVKMGDDGCYHIAGTSVHEDFWGTKDGITDLAAIRGTVPLAWRASEILGVDKDLRTHWQELLQRLAPYPLGCDPEAKALTDGVLADDTWAAGHLGDVDGSHNLGDVWLNPIFPFEDWTLETCDPVLDRIAQKAVDLAPRMKLILDGADCNTAIRTPIAAVRAGRGEQLPAMLASYYRAFTPLANGWGLFEGADQAHSIEVLGCVSMVLQEGLLQSVSPRPGQPEVIRVFPAWPGTWEASFRLLARGGFLVTAAIHHGEVAFVEIESRLGEACRLRNPWGSPCLVGEVEEATQELVGDILCFDTAPGGCYRVLPKGAPMPTTRRISPNPATGPTSYSFTLANGTVASGMLGRRNKEDYP